MAEINETISNKKISFPRLVTLIDEYFAFDGKKSFFEYLKDKGYINAENDIDLKDVKASDVKYLLEHSKENVHRYESVFNNLKHDKLNVQSEKILSMIGFLNANYSHFSKKDFATARKLVINILVDCMEKVFDKKESEKISADDKEKVSVKFYGDKIKFQELMDYYFTDKLQHEVEESKIKDVKAKDLVLAKNPKRHPGTKKIAKYSLVSGIIGAVASVVPALVTQSLTVGHFIISGSSWDGLGFALIGAAGFAVGASVIPLLQLGINKHYQHKYANVKKTLKQIENKAEVTEEVLKQLPITKLMNKFTSTAKNHKHNRINRNRLHAIINFKDELKKKCSADDYKQQAVIEYLENFIQNTLDTEIQNTVNEAYINEEVFKTPKGEKIYFKRYEQLDDNTCKVCEARNGMIVLYSDDSLSNQKIKDNYAHFAIWEGCGLLDRKNGIQEGAFHPWCRGSWFRYYPEVDDIFEKQ